jgi:hypothetical protein
VPSSRPADRIPARTDNAATKRLVKVLNGSLSTVCVGPSWAVMPLPDGSPDEYTGFTRPDQAVAFRTRSGDKLYLRSTIRFTLIDDPNHPGERKASTREYAHTVGCTDSLKPQLYSWEWHPSEPGYPHVHVRRGDPAHKGLGKLHIPTGRVFFESVLLFLIRDHDVLTCRDEWRDVLGDSLRRVSKYSTWGGGITPDVEPPPDP